MPQYDDYIPTPAARCLEIVFAGLILLALPFILVVALAKDWRSR